MRIDLDPSKWFVALAGFMFDWALTRQWLQLLTRLVPTLLVVVTMGLVWWGKTLDANALAARYMAIVEEQLQGWEQSWADGEGAQSQATDGGDAAPGPQAVAAGNVEAMPRFVEALVRRVQMLAPNRRSRFLLGANMIQHGAVRSGIRMLETIAPPDGKGYEPAHGFLSLVYLERIQKGQASPNDVEVFLHHVSHGGKWASSHALWAASDILFVRGMNARQQGNPQAREQLERAVKLLKEVANRRADAALELCKRATVIGDKLILEEFLPKAEAYWRKRIERDPQDATARVNLATTLTLSKRIDDAEQILKAGLELGDWPEVRRALSELYRGRFVEQLRQTQKVDLRMLEVAFRYDPTNPRVYEVIAGLIRMGQTPSEELQDRLQEVLVNGQATATTHLLLAESYLVKEEYSKAVPHLEQVVTRMPTALHALNNLAWILARFYPERMDEALELIQRAVAASRRHPNPEYYDTLGMIHAARGELKQAIASYETAIELAPDDPRFHLRLAELYDQIGNKRLAELHRAAASLPSAKTGSLPQPGTDKSVEDGSAEADAPPQLDSDSDQPPVSAPQPELAPQTEDVTSSAESSSPETSAPKASDPETPQSEIPESQTPESQTPESGTTQPAAEPAADELPAGST